MQYGKLWTIAYRDLFRNRRRSIFTMLAVALGLAMLITFNGLISGVWADALQNSIRLRTGHLQLRAPSYDEKKVSLQWKDLLDNPDIRVANIKANSEVQAATPVLWAGTILSAGDETVGSQIFGIEPSSSFYDPFRESLVAGEFLAADDRSGIMIGQALAHSLGVGVNDKLNLAVVNANGDADEANFTIRGLFSTGVVSFDESMIFMPLGKAQAFTGTGQRASSIVVLLNQQDDTEKIAAAIDSQGAALLTWEDANSFLLEAVELGFGFYLILDGIVMLIVGVIIANTLLMSVFERIREIGVLAALGMRGRQITLMFLFEAFILGLGGVLVGLALGLGGVAILSSVGIPMTSSASTTGTSIALGARMYASFAPTLFMWLSIWMLVFVLVASLYPARFAARQEPVDALRSL